MTLKFWKRTFWISAIFLILLIIFTYGLWIMANVGAALMRIVFILDEDLQLSGIPFAKFMENFVGSPLFYMYIADLTVLLCSAVAWTAKRKAIK